MEHIKYRNSTIPLILVYKNNNFMNKAEDAHVTKHHFDEEVVCYNILHRSIEHINHLYMTGYNFHVFS